MHHRTERVVVETERHRVTGSLTLPLEGYRSRVSDFLNSSEHDFISVTDVIVEPVDGSAPASQHEFIMIAKRHIVLASQAPSGPQP